MAVAGSRLHVVPAELGIDHVTIAARDVRRARHFYEHALGPLGFSVMFDWPDGGRACLGVHPGRSSVWLVEDDEPGRASLSLAAPDGTTVDAFYKASLAAGGVTLSAPAFRPEYTATTYAARVLDPDGNTIEAICRRAEPVGGLTENAA